MNKHTPGPWVLRPARTLVNVKGPRGEQICQLDWPVISQGVRDNPDARLIAAAPELKDQLVTTRAALGLLAMAFCQVARSSDDKKAVEWAREVCATVDRLLERIAKAEGRK